ncbi:MAG: hypothetical protein STHCBS139747_005378 [Sporothrix thermara]
MAALLRGRLRTVAIVTVIAAAGVGLTVRRQSNALRANELSQHKPGSPAMTISSPNLYVSVDRSGGGI